MKHRIREKLHETTHHDATGGIIMIVLTIIALCYQNSDYAYDYRAWLETNAGVVFGSFSLQKPILLWINDGLITIFFFTIGLELKHEFMEGHLSKASNVVLPGLAALGGIIFPAVVFSAFNLGDPFAMRGWAIPAATDAAFSVAILLLLGKRLPPSLKIFLLSLAIFDDIGAIIVIALFYTSKLSLLALCFAGGSILILAFLNFMSVQRKSFYYIVGAILWFSILKSGVHATLAGIITAFFIPLKKNDGTPLVTDILEHSKFWIAMVILPLFAFANAGVDLSGVSVDKLLSPVPLGIFLGLFVGKQVGVFAVSFICIKLKLASLPKDSNFKQLYGVCILTGIGFTMSMFVNGLAYGGTDEFAYTDSLAIILGSTLSGIVGYIYLLLVTDKNKTYANDEDLHHVAHESKAQEATV